MSLSSSTPAPLCSCNMLVAVIVQAQDKTSVFNESLDNPQAQCFHLRKAVVFHAQVGCGGAHGP